MPTLPLPKSILISALASKPQLITLALDCLSARGEPPAELVVLHTDAGRDPTRSGLAALKRALPVDFPPLTTQYLQLDQNGAALRDITAPDEVNAAFRTLFGLVRSLKLDEYHVHLLISGGRRTLTVFGMAVAQMLFDDQDQLWHLASHPDLEASGRLHAAEGEWARLIPIPVIPWGRLSPVFDSLRDVEDPFDAVQRLGGLRLREQWDAARIFLLTQLTASERQAVELLVREGLTQSEIADRLSISPRTVEQHLRSAYRKAADHWELADVNQAQLVRLLGVYCTNTPKDTGKPA